MSIKDYIDAIYSSDHGMSPPEIAEFFISTLPTLEADERPLAAGTVIRFLAPEAWSTALSLAPLALQETKEWPEDRMMIVESLVLFKPEGADMPEFLSREIAALDTETLSEAVLAAKLAYRAQCLHLLLLARAEASAEELHTALKKIERAAWVLYPGNELLTSALSALAHRVGVLEPFNAFLQQILAVGRVRGEVKRVKTESLVRQFQQDDFTWLHAEE